MCLKEGCENSNRRFSFCVLKVKKYSLVMVTSIKPLFSFNQDVGITTVHPSIQMTTHGSRATTISNLVHRVLMLAALKTHRRPTYKEMADRAVDPMFVDPGNGDFRLKPNSPALKLSFLPFDMSKVGLRSDKK